MSSSSSGSSAVVGVRKGAWTPEEDLLLKKCIHKFGEGKWHQVPIRAGLNRCRKSCRLRWMNYLKPDIKRGEFTSDEVDIIIRMHKLLGNRWSLIAGRIPGRTANDIKNYWNTHLKQKRPPSQSRNKKVIIMKELADQSDDHDHQATKIKALRPQPRAFTRNCQWLLSRIRSRVEKLPLTDHHQEAPSKQSKELDFPQVAEEGSPWWETILFIDDEENARNGCGSQSSMEEEELMITKYSSIIDAMEPERCNEENPLMEEGRKSDWGNLFLDLGLWDLVESEN